MTVFEQLQKLEETVSNLDSEVQYTIGNEVWSFDDYLCGVEALRNESAHIQHHLQTLLETIGEIQKRISEE